MADLGRLAIDLEANIVRFEQSLNRADQIARKQSRAIEKSLSGIDVAMARVNADSARMVTSIDKVSSQVDALSQTTSRYLQLAAGMFAVSKIEAFARASVMAASRYNVLGTVLQTIGRNAGYTADQLSHVETALQQSGISKLESRQGVARMMQGGLDLSLAPKLARIAQDAAVIGNMGSSQAFNHLLYGIQTAQVEVLRTIGINVSFEGPRRRWAAQRCRHHH